MSDRVASVETFIVTVPRDTPYLGPLGPGETINPRGYIVRKGNGTIYPIVDRSIVVRVTTEKGAVGWGETYGICAPRATCEIINDLLAPVLIGSDPQPVEAIWDRLYDLMRVRGCTGGFHGDALAALDIALWDLRGQAAGKPIRDLIGPIANATVPGYVSGLPAATLEERVALAVAMQREGHQAFKFAAVVSHDGIVEEMAALRQALGFDAEILIDLHWKFSADEALALIRALAPYRPGFVEAPVKPEDMAGLARVARESPVPIAAGEEWYTAYEAANRLAAGPVAILQPEMGHTGITQFLRIAALAARHGARIAPHATVGTGLFLAASLQVSSTLPQLWKHEWQHSIFSRNLAFLDSDMGYADGAYRLPSAPGLGAAPNARLWDHAEAVA
ncbi:MAG TPA: mandelate racemase/muconate lactonizing enzyme family protein [Sphingomonas sp.]|uniref:mandelate racemase/muconate lactonizing enzyme family protein n=1 Tax=Sphingomonas sp. TaxID=28214 RepID=UPI002B8CA4F6|nr:mandelate racemase/muconate lactonizing enzyme family protein [Sphingomonas sp.]HMI19528.1 mandelate racemase/muconate lactonizing enzyme family protein [Sphingomonas sp.]